MQRIKQVLSEIVGGLNFVLQDEDNCNNPYMIALYFLAAIAIIAGGIYGVSELLAVFIKMNKEKKRTGIKYYYNNLFYMCF